MFTAVSARVVCPAGLALVIWLTLLMTSIVE